MKTVLITGAAGQLGKCFQKHAKKFSEFEFLFCDAAELDITSKTALTRYFKKNSIDVCVNCAAYTNVEEAETNQNLAFSINAEGAKNIAEVCEARDTVLFHISTDYVFDGEAKVPYSEESMVNPINVYGASKLKGEEYIQQTAKNYFITRTSWLYSEFGNNFYKTILKKANENADLKITTSQLGTPTNANDLAVFILKMMAFQNKNFGIYHYSNEGEATWYDFAEAILRYTGKLKNTNLQKSGFYKTKAERPVYSVLSKEKIKKVFNYPILNWEDSLKQLISEN